MKDFQNNYPSPPSSTQSNPPQVGGLIDGQGRRISYLRLAITDRCNLRCRYCRPEDGVPFIPHNEILRFEELERLVAIFCSLGINKVRVTGGEPFSRRGCLPFLTRLRKIDGVQQLHITTNGVKTSRHLNKLSAMGIDGINLSLDTLDQKRFWKITRRDYLEAVLQTLYGALAWDIPLKINSVVLEDTCDDEIIQLAGLAKYFPITLRFIERMPFSGTVRSEKLENGNLSQRLKKIFPAIEECTADLPTTASIFALPGYKGNLGIIQGYSRLFCQTCNKVRITPTGMLKTCLYDNGALDLKMMLRTGAGDQAISNAIVDCVQNRFDNGHEAERFSNRTTEPSMAMIGG
ncbi:MAG: GTP 3',8-cyclase MoaA [Desulfobacterales bacterium]|nr:GTP 3',8-cyclase MoaA [Desulfobacterales bacterium]